MSRCDKLFRRARNSASNLRFEDACYLAECYGFVFARQNGTSHKMYRLENHPELANFQKAKNGKAKSYQVEQLLDLIERYELKCRMDTDDEDATETGVTKDDEDAE